MRHSRGIPGESIDKIFLKFYQVESSGQNSQGEVGLGFAIVRENVSTYGGSISVASELGKGSTFTCEFHITLTTYRNYKWKQQTSH